MTGSANIAAHLPEVARLQPNRIAYHCRNSIDPTVSSFAFLDKRSDRIARGLAAIGVVQGMRVALMQPPGPDFLAVTFALFKLGSVPVLIDPGMGIRGVGRCLSEAEPAAFIGIFKAHLARQIFRWARTSKIQVHTSGFPLGHGWSLRQVEQLGQRQNNPVLADVVDDDLAAILFTSGSTGPAKGVVYTHRMFQEQLRVLRETFGIQPGEVDLCTFPLFSLFAPALGMISVIPEMDPTRPAKADPRMLVDFICLFGVSNLFGSPALVNTLSNHTAAHSITLPTVRRVISAGAPVSASIIERMTKALSPGVQVFTPYGATEALPVAVIGSDEILRETRSRTDVGAGICVGRAVGRMEIAIIPISDQPIADWSAVKPLPVNQIGEITVRGPVVSPAYFQRPDATTLAKISDTATGTFWHRMGDVGYLDNTGRLWFCGRKSQRVVTPQRIFFTIPCEGIFIGQKFQGQRAALVGVGINGVTTPVICIEWGDEKPHPNNTNYYELQEIADRFEPTKGIKNFLNYPGWFPVDIRHNAKIGREKLAIWATRKLR